MEFLLVVLLVVLLLIVTNLIGRLKLELYFIRRKQEMNRDFILWERNTLGKNN